MKYFVAVTDNDWYSFLAERKPEEVNFWKPSAPASFKAISQGSPFLFKLHAPLHFIVGGGIFIKYERLPLYLAWDAFGESNGASDIGSVLGMIKKYNEEAGYDYVVGCIILSDPFFFEREDWLPMPPDWPYNIPGKSYDTDSDVGRELWMRVSERLLYRRLSFGEDLLRDAALGEEGEFDSLYLARARYGQGAFRILVTSAYNRRCAITGERVLPVLEASHIKPYAVSGPNLVNNGLLLRADIHKLFDSGYLTVTPDLHVEISRAIQEEFENGRDYYVYHGKSLIQVPRLRIDRPSTEYLEWHNQHVYLA
jgi:putative restriction endonuclease